MLCAKRYCVFVPKISGAGSEFTDSASGLREHEGFLSLPPGFPGSGVSAGGVMNKLGRSVIAALLLGGALALAGCAQEDTTTTGSGTPGVFGTGGGGGGGGGVAPPPPPPPPILGAPSLVLTLANPTTGAVTTSIPATVRAIVRDAAGVGMPSVVVTFTTDSTFGVFVPPSGTALTDATGTATVTLNPASLSAAGAATLTATAQVP